MEISAFAFNPVSKKKNSPPQRHEFWSYQWKWYLLKRKFLVISILDKNHYFHFSCMRDLKKNKNSRYWKGDTYKPFYLKTWKHWVCVFWDLSLPRLSLRPPPLCKWHFQGMCFGKPFRTVADDPGDWSRWALLHSGSAETSEIARCEPKLRRSLGALGCLFTFWAAWDTF